MPTPADVRSQIRKLYYETTPATIERDLSRAIRLLKSLNGETERARVAVYMDGLAQMRSERILARRRTTKRKNQQRPPAPKSGR